MKELDFNRIRNIVNGFSRAKVLVVGDLILDEFIWGEVTRISPEAPIPVVHVKSESFIPGGACNVAANIRSMQGKVQVSGVIGKEGRGRMLIDLLRDAQIGVTGVVKDPLRPTILKTRVIAHKQQVVRIDREKLVPLKASMRNKVLSFIRKRIQSVDAICIEDYGKGVITPELVKSIVDLADKYDKIITVDPKDDHLLYYKGVTTITPNHHEASALAQIDIKDDVSLKKAGAKLLKILKCKQVLITLGESGMCLFQKGFKPVKIPTLAQDVFDVSGAGDTVIGTYTLALARGAMPIEAAHLANCAAGIVVGKLGTATVSQNELLDKMKSVIRSHEQ
ncbi:MAG: rfaE bifunctional protein kinase chain/domain [Candidatus Omnitrophota bacterium]|jgi:rfaE bifunctional protein kinase chain/domain